MKDTMLYFAIIASLFVIIVGFIKIGFILLVLSLLANLIDELIEKYHDTKKND